jgi:hypothetical protein
MGNAKPMQQGKAVATLGQAEQVNTSHQQSGNEENQDPEGIQIQQETVTQFTGSRANAERHQLIAGW